jgi:two-component system, OmpR family, response regulator
MGNEAERVATASLARRILVVDDEPLVCESVKWMLMSYGHVVEAVNSGDQALALFEKDKFDLVIIDYLMPGMKGDVLAVNLRKRLASQPIIIMSASGDTLRADRPLEGVDCILSKPFKLQELRDAIAKYLPEKNPTKPTLP